MVHRSAAGSLHTRSQYAQWRASASALAFSRRLAPSLVSPSPSAAALASASARMEARSAPNTLINTSSGSAEISNSTPLGSLLSLLARPGASAAERALGRGRPPVSTVGESVERQLPAVRSQNTMLNST
eukprot:scaffold91643_cov35-Tisochrysis_lutea.AAC.3